MKRFLIYVFFITLATQFSFSQIKNGFWQEKTANISDAYLGGYNFTNTTFEYSINGYDGLNPITAFGGKYTIKKNKIFFTITYMKKNIGGRLCRSETYTLNDSWSIEGGKTTVIQLNPVINSNANIEMLDDCLVIDRQKFYKVETD